MKTESFIYLVHYGLIKKYFFLVKMSASKLRSAPLKFEHTAFNESSARQFGVSQHAQKADVTLQCLQKSLI